MIYKHSYIAVFFCLFSIYSISQNSETEIPLLNFNKIDIDKFIKVTLIFGDKESIEILENNNDLEIDYKINRDKLFLKLKKPKRKITIEEKYIHLKITYNKLVEIAIKGNQTINCKNLIKSDELKIVGYGNSNLYISNVSLKHLKTRIYGNFNISIESGNIQSMKIRAFGNSHVQLKKVKVNRARVLAYGNSNLNLNVNESLKVSGLGSVTLNYIGKAVLNKGLILGNYNVIKNE